MMQQSHAKLWRTTFNHRQSVTLSFPSIPEGINKKGQVVGGHWLWHNGRSDDLNTLLPARSGWTIMQATAINNKGQIAGYGKYHRQTRAFLLTPQKNNP